MLWLVYALRAGFIWVLRGGWLGALFRKYLRFEPGTTLTRIICAFLLAAPLYFALGWAALALWLSIYAAMTIGYFDDAMGLEEPIRDHLFMALWGVAVTTLAVLPLAYFVSPWSLAWGLLGVLAVAAYWLNKPFGRRWGWDWTERAEWCMGFIFGSAVYLGAVQ